MNLDPVKTNPQHYRIVFENDRARVLEYGDAPSGHGRGRGDGDRRRRWARTRRLQDLNMLVTTSGRERSLDEHDALLTAAGLPATEWSPPTLRCAWSRLSPH